MKNQLNVNTLLGALIFAALCFFGKTVMDTHDGIIAIGSNQATMQGDIATIKATIPTLAVKADVDAQQSALWNAVREIRPGMSPKGIQAQ